jgi:phosphatidylinositol alpha-1,6-mannosyltransferase
VDERFFQDHDPGRDDLIRLLTVTRLTKYSARKNVDGVLRAVASLHPRLQMRYTIVGDGDDKPRLEALARELGIGCIVKFAGSLRVSELLGEYRCADLFVLAAKATEEDVEGFGIVYMEASASGVPVICSHEGGAVDAVEPGKNGLLIPSSSPADIAAGIEEFSRTRSQYRPESVRRVAEKYRWPQVAGCVDAVIAKHARGPRSSSVHEQSAARQARAALWV